MTEQKIKKLNDLKTATMNELLTESLGHKYRFIEYSLHELIRNPICGSRPKGGVDFTGEVPSFGGENISATGNLNFFPVRKIPKVFYNQMKSGHLQNLDVLINKDGANTGKSAIYRASPYRSACINEHLFILRGFPDKIDQIFLHYLLLSSKFRRTLASRISGSAQPGLNSRFCHNFPVTIPPLEIQRKISKQMTSIDDAIEANLKRHVKLQLVKKGLMEDLLTGKVRVKVEE